MKTKVLLVTVACASISARATLFSSSPDAVIPDNNPSGYVSTINVSGLGSQLSDLSVNINVSGGYNGDLYGYLTYNGQTVVLLDRTGTGGGNAFGYSDPGFNITLNDAGNFGLHFYQANGATFNGSGQLQGTWQPDSSGVTFASAFNGVNPNGNWQLFFADMSAADQSTLVSWSLDMTTPVPEPVNVTLALFTGALMTVGATKAVMRRQSQPSLNCRK